MAAPQQVRAVPLVRALRLRARASAAAPSKSPETSRRALLGLTEPELRQLAVDLGQVRAQQTPRRAEAGATFARSTD
jgi:23S rRNA (adenine2503-C2)-methyltransferase